jgi:sec-independent protein translocase protein TatC
MSSNREKSMSLMGHLRELRKRITWAAAAIVVCTIAAFVEKKYVFVVLMRPLNNTQYAGQKLLAFTATEPFMAILKISVYAGLIIALPFVLWQFWAFVMPALYENEKRSIFPYVGLTAGLFLGGVAFGYFVVLPIGLKWLLNFSAGQFTVMLHVDAYVSFISLFLLAFGAVFELPVIMLLLAWAGIVDYKRMAKVRKYAVLVEAVVAMVITPSQDPISMMLMLIPLIILYEFGIWLSRITSKRRARRKELEAIAAAGIPENSTPAAEV